MPTLYVLEPGAQIEIEHQRFLVTKDDETLLRLPVRQVSQVVLVGRVGLTTPALHELLRLRVPVVFLSSGGVYLGQVAPAETGNLPLRLCQYRRNDDAAFGLEFGRAVVAGKIHNQRLQLERWRRRFPVIPSSGLEALERSGEEALHAPNSAALLGIEGSAARLYFEEFERIVAPEWNFHGRNRRPPLDPVNAMLSLGYTLLLYTLCAALQIVGLDPYLGYYHVEVYGRPTLALDLLEEFRAPVVDALVATLVHRRKVSLEDFISGGVEHGVLLKPHALRLFVNEFGLKLKTPVKTAESGRSISYQKHFEVQARQLAHLVEGKIDTYLPFKAR